MGTPATDAEAFASIRSNLKGGTQTTSPVKEKSQTEQEKDASQARAQRYTLMWIVAGTLWAELLCLFWLIHKQGAGEYKLNEWLFGFFINGVLLQTFFSLRTIITHLFPDGQKEFGNTPPKLRAPAKKKQENPAT